MTPRLDQPPRPSTDLAERSPFVLLALVPLALGLALWGTSLGQIDAERVGEYGLLEELPALWFAALAVLVAGAATVISTARRPAAWLMAAYVAAVAAVLYATLPAVADVPQYPWVYKHIGVTQMIDLRGGIDTDIDIYNRWPGLFALGAAFGRLAGVSDPVSWAAWAEPMFMLVDALLVAAIAHTLTRSGRVAGSAALIFVLVNWVGQTYYSPQAAASTMALVLLLVVLRGVADPAGRSAGVPGRPLGWPPYAVIGVVLGLDLAIVITHQLTPFAVIAQVAALAVAGSVRSWRIFAAVAVLPVWFLVANISFIREHYDLVSSLDPFDNVRSSGGYDVARSAGKALNADLSLLLSAGMFAGALLAAYALHRRRGFGRLPLALLALVFAPFALALTQSYGGEASLRIILYAAPWAAVLIATAIATLHGAARRAAWLIGVAAIAAALVVPAFYGASQLNVIPRSTLEVSEDFYARAPAGSVLMLAGPGFPLRVGARYDRFEGPIADADPNLLHDDTFRSRRLGAADIPAIIREMRAYADRGFLAFSTTEERWAHAFGLTPPGALADLEQAVLRSPRFRLWNGSATARIYELVPAR